MKYRVVKEYKERPESPIQVVKGEQLRFIEESDPNGDWANWLFCRGVGKEGWVPKQILHVDNESATVLEDYDATEHFLVVGEVLVKHHELNGWIWCHKVDAPNESGWAPLNHLSLL